MAIDKEDRPDNSLAGMWACDFECTTAVDYAVEQEVRCYLWHARELESDEEAIGYDVESFIHWLEEGYKGKIKWCIYHNLKYDGSFILDFCLRSGWTYGGPNHRNTKKHKTRIVETLITDMGQWMTMTLKFGTHVVHFMDSAKKFPSLSLEELAKLYNVPGKSSLDVYRRRPPGTPVTEEEIARVKGDTRILAVAMRDVLGRGMSKLTMASDAKAWFSSLWIKKYGSSAREMWRLVFPDIPQNLDDIFRKAYMGGWVYLAERYRGQIIHDVHVYDVNSMFPAQMIKVMPYGMPVKVKSQPKDGWWIIRFVTSFRLRPCKLPFLHEKRCFSYDESEFITDSDGPIELTLCREDYRLFEECYESEYEVRKEWWRFNERVSPFIDYIEFWMAGKKNAKTQAEKSVCKRYLNSCYGKLAEQRSKLSKVPYYDSDTECVKFDFRDTEGRGWYLPMGIAITALARTEIVHFAEKFGDRFVYSDTDSVHVIGEEVPEGMPIDPKELGKWKHESVSRDARYVGAKKYVHCGVTDPSDPDFYDECVVTCAGMPKHCKENVNIDNFKSGAQYKGKLAGKTVKGGYVLTETEYTVRVH